MHATAHLIDASPYIFRAFFSLPDSLRAPDGAPVNAVYGFASFLLKLLAEERPTHVGVAFDGSLTTSFRNDWYPEYKAQRELPPAELEAQLDACREVVAALGIVAWIDARYEADDLIGTAVAQLGDEGAHCVVVSSDKDLAQLVDARVELFDFAKGRRWDAAAVEECFGVPPRLLVDYLGLAGDAVDNIPGVRGVGPKTAAALLRAVGGMEEIYSDLERVAALSLRGARSLARKLEEERETALLSRRLATIARDAPLRTGAADLAWGGARRDLLEPLFERLGFERLAERVPFWRPAD